ncbi:amidohydrolase family protein [Paraburkholderia sp. HD33-4]|uniref:amidohydrolase family protein n=1 Tax=Paraburkholderia sp. HD33-4 TaxID=2883242 RepID=UPI001F26130B|nr:amidohydrolase family protein [Paraburkholderia sp. HD33-4]
MTIFNDKRRSALKTLGALAAASSGVSLAGCAHAPSSPVVWSAGTEPARVKMPPNATDCHHHIYDHSYPWAPEATLKPGNATVADYRQLQNRIGTSRNVIIQPSSYGIDNRLLLAAIAQFDGRARGVAVVNTSVTQAQLAELHKGGVRGIRFNLAPPGTTTLEMVKPLAKRIAAMGWHIQVNAPAAYLLDARGTWYDLPCPVVFDHLAHIPEPDAVHHPAFQMVSELLVSGKAFVKLTGFYNDTKVGPPNYSDSVAVAAAYAQAAPDRVLWGSDWPHPTEQPLNRIPDDALLANLLMVVVPEEARRNKSLVDNPAGLYQF